MISLWVDRKRARSFALRVPKPRSRTIPLPSIFASIIIMQNLLLKSFVKYHTDGIFTLSNIPQHVFKLIPKKRKLIFKENEKKTKDDLGNPNRLIMAASGLSPLSIRKDFGNDGVASVRINSAKRKLRHAPLMGDNDKRLDLMRTDGFHTTQVPLTLLRYDRRLDRCVYGGILLVRCLSDFVVNSVRCRRCLFIV